MFEPRPPTIACAFRAIEAWVDGEDAQAPLRHLPDASREIAKAIARINCQMIQWHAKRVMAGGYLTDVHAKWRPMVERYIYRKMNRA